MKKIKPSSLFDITHERCFHCIEICSSAGLKSSVISIPNAIAMNDCDLKLKM